VNRFPTVVQASPWQAAMPHSSARATLLVCGADPDSSLRKSRPATHALLDQARDVTVPLPVASTGLVGSSGMPLFDWGAGERGAFSDSLRLAGDDSS